MSKQILYLLDVAAQDVMAEILVNDVIVSEIRATGRIQEQTVINAYVQGGENKITARVKPLEEGTPSLSYRVILTTRAADAPETLLTGRSLPEPMAPMMAGGPASQFNEPFPGGQAFGPWAWQAPGTQPFRAGRDEQDILRLVWDLHAAFQRRDEATIMDMLKVKFFDLGRALQLPPAELADDALEHLRYLFASRNWSLKTLEPDALVVRPMAGGLLVAPLRKDRAPLIESAGGSPYKLSLLLSHLPIRAGGAAWQIVR
jgi:hypothetical protein